MSKLLCVLAITAISLLAVNADSESRMVGGQNAVNGQFPHHVRVLIVERPKWFCGGSIIGDRFVLSSPRCLRIENGKLGELRVVAGEVDIRANATQHIVDKVIVHPESDIFVNDIAVLRVAQPFQFSAKVRAIALPTKDTQIPDDGSSVPATIVGWGQYRNGGGTPDHPRILQWMHTIAISHPECRRLLADDYPSGQAFLKDNHICTRDKQDIGACGLDAGGGLISRDTQPVLIGVLSIVWFRCPSIVPNFYSRVFPHLAFIRAAMQQQ